jgi:hypothetical protein
MCGYPFHSSPLVAFAPAGESEMSTKERSGSEAGENNLSLDRVPARAGALSSLLMPLFGALGLVFQHGELDFPLHVVDAINDHANFVADGIRFL